MEDQDARRRLRQASSEQHLVRVHRRAAWQTLEGYVMSVGAEWFLLSRLGDSIVLDGFSALRIEDVTDVVLPHTGGFVRRALELQDLWPPREAPEVVDLSATGAIVTSLRAVGPALSVFNEEDDPDVCFIGAAKAIDGTSVHLVEVSASGEWITPATEYRLADLTRIDAGGRYEQVLLLVAGPPPLTTDSG